MWLPCRMTKDGKMPEAVDITKRVEETLPELPETKINVAMKDWGDISKHKDVFARYKEPGGSLGVMNTYVMLQAKDESTNLPEEDIQCDQILWLD